MNRLLPLILATLLLEGCQLFQDPPPDPEPIIIKTEPVERRIYQPPLPTSPQFEAVNFFVITADNLDQQIEEIKQLTGDNWVVYAITPHDYENLSYNMQEITRIIRQQRDIIVYYQEATQESQAPMQPEATTQQPPVPEQTPSRNIIQRLMGIK